MGSVKTWIKTDAASNWSEVKRMFVKKDANTIWERVTKIWAKVDASTWRLVFSNANLPLSSTTDPISIRYNSYNGTKVTTPYAFIGGPTLSDYYLYGHDGTYTNYTSITDRKFVYAYPNVNSTQYDLELDDILNTQSNMQFAENCYVWYSLKAWNGTDPFNSVVFQSDPVYMIKQPLYANSFPLISGTQTPGNTLSVTFSFSNRWYESPDPYSSYVAWYKSSDGVNWGSPIKTTSFYNGASTNNGTTISGTSTYALTSADTGYYIRAQVYATNSYTDYFNSPFDQSDTTGKIGVPAPTIIPNFNPTLTLLSGTENEIGAVYRLSSGSWTNNPTQYKYHLEYNDVSGTQFAFYPSDGVSYTNNTYWDYTITGTNANGKRISGVVTANNGTDSYPAYSNPIGPINPPAPSTPTVYTTSTAANWTFNVTFNSNTTSVKLEWGTTTNYGTVYTMYSSGTYSTIGPFAIGFAYYWKATPYNGTVAGTPVTGRVYGIPNAPTGLTASQGTYTDRISLSWVAAAGANNGYQIWYNNTATGYPTNTAGSYDFTSPTNSYDDLVPSGTTRYYWVRSLNGDQFSAWHPTSSQSGISGYSLTAPGAFSFNVLDGTATPYWPNGAGINITGATSNIMTVTWNAATNAASSGTNYAYADQVSGVYNSSLYATNNTIDTWGYSASGNEYATVYAYNYNTQVTIVWTASPNAVSYTYAYSDGTGTKYGTSYGTSAVVPIPYGNTCLVYYVTAWTGINGTGFSTNATIAPGGSNQITPTVKSTSASAGPFYLTYTAPSYTVTWNANGGTVSPSSSTGSTVTAPTPTRSGYTFNGWYTASSGGSYVVGAGGSYSPTSNVTLYAQWTVVANTAPGPMTTPTCNYASGPSWSGTLYSPSSGTTPFTISYQLYTADDSSGTNAKALSGASGTIITSALSAGYSWGSFTNTANKKADGVTLQNWGQIRVTASNGTSPNSTATSTGWA